MSTTITAAGVAFHAEVSGAGPWAVFVHGLEGDLHSWDALWKELGDGLTKLRYDLRGSGHSSDSGGGTFDHAEDLAHLLDAAGIERCSLIGVSKGGAIALNFALDHPERVERLVLISPAIVAWEWSEGWKALWRPIVEQARQGDLEGARRLWWQHPLFAAARSIPAGASLFDSIMRYSGAEWIDDRQKHRMPDVERLPMLRVPTLLMTGQKDLPDFRLMADLIAGSADCLRRIGVADAGHMLNLERPQLCAREILAFLSAGPA